jgi:hypothetical protein
VSFVTVFELLPTLEWIHESTWHSHKLDQKVTEQGAVFSSKGGAVNNRTRPQGNAVLSANPMDSQDLCSLAMDRVIGIEKASMDTACYRKPSWFRPLLGYLCSTVAKAIGFCMESQRNWLALRVPRVASGRAAGNSGSQAQPTAEVLERSMDIAIGVQHVTAPASRAASTSVSKAQPKPTPDELAYSMDIAIGVRAMVPASKAVGNSGSQESTAELPEHGKGKAVAAKAGN